MTEQKKIVIVGAGPAGLTAAWELMKDENCPYEVTVLEMSDAVGGMAKSVIHNGDIMDVGGHRFFSKEKMVLEWWKNIFDRKEATQSLLLRHRKVSIYYRKQFFDYPVTLNLKNISQLGIMNAYHIVISYLKYCIYPRKECSLEDFYVNRFGKKLYAMFFEKYTEKLCGAHPRLISSQWGKERVRGLSVGKIVKKQLDRKGWQTSESLLSPSLFYYPKHGPGELWELVAEDIVKKGGVLHLNCRVVNWKQREDGSIESVMVKCASGVKEIRGDIFVSSMPLRELIQGMNMVPEAIRLTAEKLSYRSFVSIGLWVNCLKVAVSEQWIYVHEDAVKVCRIQFCQNWSPYLVQEQEKQFIALEYFCEEGDEFWSLSEEECMQIAVKEAIELGILDRNVQVLDWHRERIAKAYPGYHSGYEGIEIIRNYISEIENLYCMGRNGLHQYWNMDRCMISAWDTVEQIKKKCPSS